jgi:hypothetical protein
MGRGFQSVQGSIESGTEGGMAGLTAKGLDPLGTAMLAISHQSMDLRIGDPVVLARFVWASKALGHHAFGRSAPTLDLSPWSDSPRRKFLA